MVLKILYFTCKSLIITNKFQPLAIRSIIAYFSTSRQRRMEVSHVNRWYMLYITYLMMNVHIKPLPTSITWEAIEYLYLHCGYWGCWGGTYSRLYIVESGRSLASKNAFANGLYLIFREVTCRKVKTFLVVKGIYFSSLFLFWDSASSTLVM